MSIIHEKNPVVGGELSLYPEDLLGGIDDQQMEGIEDQETGRQWWVVYTKSRQEKALARSLRGYEIPFYLPLVEKTTVYRRSKLRSQVPLFGSYLFMFASPEERVVSLTTNRISRAIEVPEPEGLRHDLRQIFELIASGAPLTVENRLRPGARVRVRHGDLGGLEGTVVKRRGKARLIVHVNFLQQGASVEIDDYMLEPIGPPPIR